MSKHILQISDEEIVEIEGQVRILDYEGLTAKECSGNACNYLEYRINTNRTVTLRNNFDKSIIVRINWGSILGCGVSNTYKLFGKETMHVQFPNNPSIIGVCLPINVNLG